jgi:hypothetical protein
MGLRITRIADLSDALQVCMPLLAAGKADNKAHICAADRCEDMLWEYLRTLLLFASSGRR